MTILGEMLMSVRPPWVFVVRAPWRARLCDGDDGAEVVRVLDGRRLKTHELLFDEFSKAFKFPGYFGRNWAAFDECMADLSWLPGASYLIVIENAECLLCDEKEEGGRYELFFKIVTNVCAEWSQRFVDPDEWWSTSPTPFNIVMSCDDKWFSWVTAKVRAAVPVDAVMSLEE